MVLTQGCQSDFPEQPFPNRNAPIIPNQELCLNDDNENNSLYLHSTSIGYSKCFYKLPCVIYVTALGDGFCYDQPLMAAAPNPRSVSASPLLSPLGLSNENVS